MIGHLYPGRPGPSRHEDACAAGGEGGRLRPDHDGGDVGGAGLDGAQAPLQQHRGLASQQAHQGWSICKLFLLGALKNLREEGKFFAILPQTSPRLSHATPFLDFVWGSVCA